MKNTKILKKPFLICVHLCPFILFFVCFVVIVFNIFFL
jgi:hypothetical protein